MSSPSLSTPTTGHPHINEMHPSPPGGPNAFPASHGQVTAASRQTRTAVPINAYQGSSLPPTGQTSQSGEFHPPSLTPSYPNYTPNTQSYAHTASAQSHSLPPFSSLSTLGPPAQQGNVSSLRYQATENSRHLSRNLPSGAKRQAPSSNVTSADSSDLDEEDNGELPASGLVAPWEVLRGLADVAIRRAAKVCS
jgi:hypothetical protein